MARSILRKVEDKWLDPDFIVRRAIATFETTYYGGEAIPSYLIMAGGARKSDRISIMTAARTDVRLLMRGDDHFKLRNARMAFIWE